MKDITIPKDKELMMTASHQLLHSLSEYTSFFIKSNIVKDSVNIRYHYLMNILLDDISSFVEDWDVAGEIPCTIRLTLNVLPDNQYGINIEYRFSWKEDLKTWEALKESYR